MSVARAPGRVNLIGDHTDYQDGFCLPLAIDRDVQVEFAPRPGRRIVVHSRNFDGVVDIAADGSDDPRAVEPAWGRTVAAVVQVLAERGRPPVGFDANVAATIPVGSGLSSSAAFEVAVALAAAHTASFAIEGDDLALAAQEAEHRATGVPCGIMDQMASVHGRAGHALLLDCRNRTIEPVAIPAGVAVLVVHSGVARTLETSAYAERRAACEAAAARLGVPALRDATLAQVDDDPIARHVVSENARVLACAEALRLGDVARAGTFMLESHASLRDDFMVSIPALDNLVERLQELGAHGARLTGAGFGGCVVALADDARAQAIADELQGWIVHAAHGASVA
jgi:galactokinase